MSKPQESGESQQSNPPADKKPVDKNERPRPSMRGM
jgi:hypothetical protein